ncbi:MarR family transcriptional regulator [bacterium]|nr:MAG: MarR family transcriptional regulator [bacterium]
MDGGAEVARLLGLAERRLSRAVDRALAVLGSSAAQWPVLEALWEGAERTPAELARSAHVEGPPMSRMLGRMEQAGLIKRRDDPADHRRCLIGLTPKGARLREVLPGVADRVVSHALEHLDPERRERLAGDLTALVAALEESRPGC